MDQLIQETGRNREMLNQIADRTFTTNTPDQGMLPTGQEVSQKYILTSYQFFLSLLFLAIFESVWWFDLEGVF